LLTSPEEAQGIKNPLCARSRAARLYTQSIDTIHALNQISELLYTVDMTKINQKLMSFWKIMGWIWTRERIWEADGVIDGQQSLEKVHGHSSVFYTT
jgi:hypothetical protein